VAKPGSYAWRQFAGSCFLLLRRLGSRSEAARRPGPSGTMQVRRRRPQTNAAREFPNSERAEEPRLPLGANGTADDFEEAGMLRVTDNAVAEEPRDITAHQG
jgi:hypothetical protein